MSRLQTIKRPEVIAALVEGTSINATVLMTGVAKRVILKPLNEIACVWAKFHDRIVRNVKVHRRDCAFVGFKSCEGSSLVVPQNGAQFLVYRLPGMI